MSAQKFPSRLFAVERHASFQSNFTPIVEIIAHHKPWKSAYGETREYLSLTEHNHILAEKDELLKVAREALDKVDCQCTVSERLSGHKTDCFIPELTEALNKLRGET